MYAREVVSNLKDSGYGVAVVTTSCNEQGTVWCALLALLYSRPSIIRSTWAKPNCFEFASFRPDIVK